MPLPIAVGGVSLSSERLKGPYQPTPAGSSLETEADSKKSKPLVSEQRPYQSVTWAVCPRNEWQARTVVYFFDMDDESSGEKVSQQQQQEQSNKRKRKRMVEIRVQISPLARALSPKAYRESSYHLEFFTYDDDEDDSDDCDASDRESNSCASSDDYEDDSCSSDSETDDDDNLGDQFRQEETHRQPQVVFSQDRRHLMVLLFHSKNRNSNHWNRKVMEQQQSAIIVFQLRKPKNNTFSSQDIRSKIPLPSYIAKATPGSSVDGNASGESIDPTSNSLAPSALNIGGSPVVASYPKFVPSCKGITAICRLNGETSNPSSLLRSSLPNPTYFLAIKDNGTLNWVDAHSVQITATTELSRIYSNNCFVSSMTASPASTLDSGMVALVVTSSNSSLSSRSGSSRSSASYITDYEEEEVDDIAGSIESIASSRCNSDENSGGQRVKGGDCVLIKWSVSSQQSYSSEKDRSGGEFSGVVKMGLKLVWSPPSCIDENDQLVVTSVCFGSLSSVLCVVYTHSNEGKASLGPRQKLAQILTISDSMSNHSNERGDLVPTVSLYLSPDQVEQAPNVANVDQKTNCYVDEDIGYCKGDNKSYDEYATSIDEVSSDESSVKRKENHFYTTMESRLVGIQHDPGSDSFVISSIFCGSRGMKNHWVGCVWNWRANAIGWMIQHEMPTLSSSSQSNVASCSNRICWSRLFFGRDPFNGGGPYLVYMNSLLRVDGTNEYGNPIDHDIKTSKRFVPAAMLSPTNSSDPVVFAERSSILLGENHVSFPSISSKDSDVTVRELDWKISALPLSYKASQGAPRIAVMGPTRGKSIAVASCRGVCVMETYHKKWKQFGSPSEERSFSVLAMTWWEGSLKGGKDDKRDDLLVAITQTTSGERFLSCWSSKRLDLMHQLMDTPDLEWKPGESQDPEPSWGIPLPKNIRVTSISLLPEPETDPDIPGDDGKPRRALALVYSPDISAAECNYLVFRLQVFRNKVSTTHSSEPFIARRPFYVMAHSLVQGSMNCNDHSEPVTSAFIASACFQFDMRQSKRKKTVEVDEGDFVATLGVTRTPGGIQALSVFKNGKTYSTSLANHEVSKYQLSDRILSDAVSSIRRTSIVRYLWTIELLNGNVICWSIPSVVGSYSDGLESLQAESSVLEYIHTNVHSSKRSKGLDRPSLVCRENALDKSEHWFLGTLCEVGSVSDWAIQSTFGCQFDISLGQVPHMMFGCVLRCGQKSQKFARDQVGDIDNKFFSSNVLESNSYSQSPFTITPPAFVIPLYTLLLEASHIQMDINAAESASHIDNLKNLLQNCKKRVQHRLTSVRNTDSSMMALRLVTFRSLEMIAKTLKSHSKENSLSTEFNLHLSQTLLTTVVDAARACTSDLQFASLFLEVGRQTEPSNLQHLFPLPLPVNKAEIKLSPGIIEARSVVDLFSICIDKGSLAASASALPLLTSKAQARYYCELLLDEAIENFVQNSSPNECKFDSTEEERRVLGDIFRFGMKLEDAEFYEEKMIAESQDGRGSTDSTSVNTADRSVSSQIFAPESPQKRNLICSLTASNSILHYFVPSSMLGESKKQRMEDAIRREASSFIKRSLDDPILDFAVLPDWGDSFGSPNTNIVDTNSVGYLVGDALLELLQNETSSNNWKVIAAFAKLILHDGIDAPSTYDVFVEVADKAQPLDVLSIIPETYDIDNGLEQNMSCYIEEETSSCARQISFNDANHIIDMSLLLIDRVQLLPHSDIAVQKVLELSLAFIIIVVGDISGRSQYIQDILQEGSLISKCYERYIRSSQDIRRKLKFKNKYR